MPLAHTVIAVACIAGLLTLPAAAGAENGKFARSHVIKTPQGSQLAVPVTVNYRLDGKGQSLKRSRLTTRVAVAAKLPGGQVLRAVEKRTVPGRARVKVEHHPFFSVRETRLLRRALAGGPRVKVTVASSLQADLDGDGKSDARSARKIKQILAGPTAERSPAPVAHQDGENPCGALGLSSSTCANVTGRIWTATHFWDAAETAITCPPGFPFATGSVSTKTSSPRYAQSVIVTGPADRTTRVRIEDDNVRGHPIAYTPTAACTTTDMY